VAVDDYEVVKAGQPIAEIDPADYRAQRDLAQADLAVARASLAGIGDKRAIQFALIEQIPIAPPQLADTAPADRGFLP